MMSFPACLIICTLKTLFKINHNLLNEIVRNTASLVLMQGLSILVKYSVESIETRTIFGTNLDSDNLYRIAKSTKGLCKIN